MGRREEGVWMKVNHSGGFLATEKQIDAIVEVSRRSKMDESWFGEIAEAVNKKGEKVHVVKDLENGHWLSLKFAVKVMNEGIFSVRDYIDDPSGVDAYYSLLYDLGIEDWVEDKMSNWTARMVSRSKIDLTNLLIRIGDEDRFYHRFRPMRVKVQPKTGVYYMDIGDAGKWEHSLCLWYCSNRKLAYDACFWGPDNIVHHVLTDGKNATEASTGFDIPLFMGAEDILEGRFNGANGVR